MKYFRGAVLILFFVAVAVTALPAFASESLVSADVDIETQLSNLGLRLVLFTLAGIFVLLLGAMAIQKPTELMKRSFFWGITIAVTTTTFILVFFSVTLNSNSWSKGPIHWHADYQVYACGEKLDLIDPTGFANNKIGSPSRHEHNDNRLHYEGVVLSSGHAKLGSFMEVLGGKLSRTSLSFPTNNGIVQYDTGDTCTNGSVGEVQAFVYRVEPGDVYTQTKLDFPEDYIIRPESAVPPGDCIIIEFDAPKAQTDKMCQSFAVAEEIGDIRKADQ